MSTLFGRHTFMTVQEWGQTEQSVSGVMWYMLVTRTHTCKQTVELHMEQLSINTCWVEGNQDLRRRWEEIKTSSSAYLDTCEGAKTGCSVSVCVCSPVQVHVMAVIKAGSKFKCNEAAPAVTTHMTHMAHIGNTHTHGLFSSHSSQNTQ